MTEEVVFRACILAVYHMSGASRMRMIFCSPLLFGLGESNISLYISFTKRLSIAHVHHALDTFYAKGGNAAAARIAFLGTRTPVFLLLCFLRLLSPSCLVFQLAYTSLFGFYASYLFLRTGSILPPITAHIFCNIMGIPMIGYELSRHSKYRHRESLSFPLL